MHEIVSFSTRYNKYYVLRVEIFILTHSLVTLSSCGINAFLAYLYVTIRTSFYPWSYVFIDRTGQHPPSLSFPLPFPGYASLHGRL